ncbi:MAG: bifunctional (p)ppGpp synthetase/guanosine-3',5'-bis(diphosphate) 3'-pyrophosphohydrolase [Chlorobi bacterium]|nr:bifunctional (p)ppGpp synthetase/guanosine-3',5'-bis(diphosphate) 3'-pyrophosphohydrolase [Chlorobiota bacterium]
MISSEELKIVSVLNDLLKSTDNSKIIKQINILKNDIDNINKKTHFNEAEKVGEISEIIVKETGAGAASVIAASLFLLFKDNEKYIKENYDASVYKLFSGLKKVPNFKTENTEKQTDNFIKLLLNITDDVRAVLVLLAYQLYNMRNYKYLSENEKKQTLNLTKNIYIPLAHRTGLYNIKTELEETLMKYSEKEMYKFIAGKLKETKAGRDLYIKNFIEPLKKMLEDAGYHFTIKGRPKSIHSIWNKMKTKEVTFEEVYDLFAIRIILKSDIKNEKIVCWNVYSLITNIYKPNPKRLRDWISAPKISGYESLHTTVLGLNNRWVEVQIRTERMDEVAEKGPASHWQYKSGKAGSGTDWLSKIRDAIEHPEENETEDRSKLSLYSDDILVFTPNNDLLSMKKGYTLLDFAFAVHSKVGETCNGGIVNGKIQPLAYELQNGDVIKILTNKNKKPNQEWLEIAKGQRTKNKIKRALKSITYDSADIGKDLLKEKIERLKLSFNDIVVQKIADYFNYKTVLELFHNIGKGNVDLQKIKHAVEFEKTVEKDTEHKNEIEKETSLSDISKNDDFLLIGDNLSGLDYKLAKCCNPLPGDKIFGFVTVNKGTKIHKISCPNAKEMFSRFPYRIIKAKWNNTDENSAFKATIFIYGIDKNGLTSEISKIIEDEFSMKLQAISLKSVSGNQFEGLVIIHVNNRKQLNDLIKRFKMIKGIKTVREK